jgi:hypothetical protein
MPVEGATIDHSVSAINSSHSEREGEATTALPVEGATIDHSVSAINSSHSEREGEATTALPVEGATRAPAIVYWEKNLRTGWIDQVQQR